MIDIAILRMAGLSDEQILRVLEIEQREKNAARRKQNRINQQNHRSRQQMVDDSADSADSADLSSPPSLKEKSPRTPLKENNPTPPSLASLRSSRKHALPADFALSESDNRYAAARGWPESKIAAELARFCDHARANARRQADWHAAWRNWVASPFQKINGNGGFHAANPAGKSVSDVAREMLAQISRDEGNDANGLLSKMRRQ